MDDGGIFPFIFQPDIVKVNAGSWEKGQLLFFENNLSTGLFGKENARFVLDQGKLEQPRQHQDKGGHKDDERQGDEKNLLSYHLEVFQQCPLWGIAGLHVCRRSLFIPE